MRSDYEDDAKTGMPGGCIFLILFWFFMIGAGYVAGAYFGFPHWPRWLSW
jgi:hypothetical protein